MGLFSGGTLGTWSKKATEIAEDTNKTYRQMQYTADTVRAGPKGSLGQFADSIYGGTLKEMVETAQGKTGSPDEPAIKDPTLRASQIDPEGELGALQNIRKKKQGRAAANLSPASGASILTSR